MTFARFANSHINLCTGRIPSEDGIRQQQTAGEILGRFARQPGLVLADEVGMGKTFVAMAVAASIILERPEDGPVVVMVSQSRRRKWLRDWAVFKQECLSASAQTEIRHGEADSGVAFLNLLGDHAESKRHIIFLSHGALSRAMNDG
jgi:hypothetical protein